MPGDRNELDHMRIFDKLENITDDLSRIRTDIEVLKTLSDAGKGKVSQKVFFFVIAVFLALLGADVTGLLHLGG